MKSIATDKYTVVTPYGNFKLGLKFIETDPLNLKIKYKFHNLRNAKAIVKCINDETFSDQLIK